MNHYTITTPFTLNWRLVAPKDFETIEYFLTPELSFVFRDITNGRSSFHIGSFLMQDYAKKEQFLRELMPQRSNERIQEAFRNSDVSAFFTLKEAEELADTFAKEGFTCRRVELLHNGFPVTLADLPPDEFALMLKECARLHTIIPMDLEHDGHVLENMYEDVQAKVTRRIMRDQANKETAHRGITKKMLVIKGAIGGALLTLSTVAFGVSRWLFRKGGRAGFLGGTACALVSIASGILGKQFAEETVDHIRKGMIAVYV